MKPTTPAALLLASVLLLGCPASTHSGTASDAQTGSSGENTAGPTALGADAGGTGDGIVVCDGAALGTPCGAPGDRRHCAFNDCVRNVCGDGWPADGEACDDGNQRDADGCSSHCELEVAPGCGNSVLEPGEECDDGNTSDADACTAACTVARCGDGVVSAGEACDDGNVSNGDSCTSRCQVAPIVELDGSVPDGGTGSVQVGGTVDSGAAGTGAAGSGAAGAGAAGSGGAAGTGAAGSGGAAGTGAAGAGGAAGGPGPSCTACIDLNCKNYQGFDLVSGCFDMTSAGDTARSAGGVTFTPAQVQACVDAMACAYAQKCGYVYGAIANDCYCGPFHTSPTVFGLDECIAHGPEGGDHPCSAAWRAATGQSTPTNVLTSISDITTPAGWAYYLLECESTFCDGSADGDCTP